MLDAVETVLLVAGLGQPVLQVEEEAVEVLDGVVAPRGGLLVAVVEVLRGTDPLAVVANQPQVDGRAGVRPDGLVQKVHAGLAHVLVSQVGSLAEHWLVDFLLRARCRSRRSGST